MTSVTEVMVEKKTFSAADGLIAVGMADLLNEILRPTDAEAIVKDDGDRYIIEIEEGITWDDLQKWRPAPGYPYVITKEPDADAPLVGERFDYVTERKKEEVWKKFRQKTGEKGKKLSQDLENAPIEPDNLLPLYKTYNSLRMGSNCLNQLYLALQDQEELREIVGKRLGVLDNYSSEAGELEGKLAKIPSPLQIFSPISGKGIHRPKPDSTTLASFPAKLVDWFDEWMKYRAMTKSMLSFFTGSDGKDTKLMVLAPARASSEIIEKIHCELLEKRLYGSVKLDINLLLNTADLLIKHSKEYSAAKGKFALDNAPPNKIIKGLYSVYFKNLGTASAVMNLSFLGLPGWFPVTDYQSARDWVDILQEHLACINTLNESHSSDVALLLTYRDYLSTGDLRLLLEVWALFGMRFMQLKAENKYAQAFTIKNVRRLLMSYHLAEIIENEGFLNIATAIRKSTINPQMRKAGSGKAPFEIHYGLAQNWKRKSKHQEDFIKEISDFVQRYNAENARHIEQGKERRNNITTEDLDQVFALVEKHGSELVGMLLLAYGYARSPKDDEKGVSQ